MLERSVREATPIAMHNAAKVVQGPKGGAFEVLVGQWDPFWLHTRMGYSTS